MITGYCPAIDGDIRLRNIGSLSHKRVEADEAVQFLGITIEIRRVMLKCKFCYD